MQYIWLNRFKVSKQRPETDVYCSASWRINPEIINKIESHEKKLELLSKLLDSYESLPFPTGTSIKRFVIDLLNAAISQFHELSSEIYENSHTIGDKIDVIFRGELLSAFRREFVPLTS